MNIHKFNPKGIYLERIGQADAYRIINFHKSESILGKKIFFHFFAYFHLFLSFCCVFDH